MNQSIVRMDIEDNNWSELKGLDEEFIANGYKISKEKEWYNMIAIQNLQVEKEEFAKVGYKLS